MGFVKHICCLLLMMATVMPASASSSEKEGGFDLQAVLFGHIKDSYEWHVTDIGDTPVVIHLPVIVKSSTGWHMFCSSEFEHHADAKGNRKGPHGLYIANNAVHENKICEMVNGEEVRPLDLSMTKTVLVLIINAILLCVCVLVPARWCKRHKCTDAAPKGFIGLMNMFIMSVYDDVIKPALGKEADRYAPYLLTCFFFIFLSNLMGVVPFPPGGGNLTGNITCTMFLALCTFVITNVTGTKEYWKEVFWPDVPVMLKCPFPLMPIIEFFGLFTKPLALMVRLFANMLAGHAIALSLTCIIFIMASISPAAGGAMSVVSVLMSIFMMLLELLVCYIQALVFTMLSAVFISLAHVKEHEPAKQKA